MNKNTSPENAGRFFSHTVTFLAGALVPAVCIYLTGGSNRTNLVIGFALALALVIVPAVRYRLALSRALVSFDAAMNAFQAATAPIDNSHAAAGRAVPIDNSHAADGPSGPAAVNPLIGDVASALHNLGTPHKQAQRIAESVAAHQKFDRFEDMFHAALAVSRKAVA